jgi:hypothetical protein
MPASDLDAVFIIEPEAVSNDWWTEGQTDMRQRHDQVAFSLRSK